jgi:signal transduction histidine kinase
MQWIHPDDRDVVRETARDKQLGLVGMRERASLLGGTLDVESQLGHGTTGRCTYPALVRPEFTNPQ